MYAYGFHRRFCLEWDTYYGDTRISIRRSVEEYWGADTNCFHEVGSVVVTVVSVLMIHSIRQAAGTTSKSSVSYAYTLDTRDDRISASRGVYAKLYQEVAGLGGDASFYKAEAETQVSRSLLSGVVGIVHLSSGFFLSLQSSPPL